MTPNPDAVILRRIPLPVLALCGSLGLWLGFANNFFTFPPAALLWPICAAFLGLLAKSLAKAFWWGWLCAFPGALASLYWLYMPLANVGGLPAPAAFLCAAAICALISCQSALFSVFCGLFKSLSVWRFAIVAVLCWNLLEYLFAFILGFPWLQLAGALIAWPYLLQHADIFGAWLGAALWLAPALAFLFSRNKKEIAGAALFCCALMLYCGWRLWMHPFNPSPEGPDSIQALFIEGNVDQNQKWTPEFQAYNLDLYLRLTRRALDGWSGAEAPLVIWPETALPFFYERSPQYSLRLAEAVRTFGCPLLFGAPGVEALPGALGEAVFNRAFLLDPQGEVIGHYDKEHLVPFGEYLPEWLDWDFLEALLQGVGIYSEGRGWKPLRYGPLAMGMLICYEGIFPWLAQERTLAGANILVDISNDGWFGQSPAALQHLRLSQPRCLEQNRWLLRATNTGISAVVDARGRIVASGPMFKTGSMAVSARLISTPSIYGKIAEWLPLASLLLLIWIGYPALSRLRYFHASFK